MAAAPMQGDQHHHSNRWQPSWAFAVSGDTVQGAGRAGRRTTGEQRSGERFHPGDQPGAGADDDAIGIDGPE